MNEDGLKKVLEKLDSIQLVEVKRPKYVRSKKSVCLYIKKDDDIFLENYASQTSMSKTQLINNAVNLFIESFERLFNE